MRLLRLALPGLLLVLSTAAFAQKKGEAAPPLDKWSAEALGKSGAFPHVIAFVTELPAKGKGEPKFLDVDVDALNKLSYFQATNPKTAEWDLKLNKKKFAKQDSLDLVLKITGADTVVLAPAKGEWQFIRSVGGKREVLAKAKAPASTKPEAIVQWFPTALGWDGVVLDQKGEFLLVGSTGTILATPQIQALAVDGSGAKFALKADERKGAGLLSLSETKAGVGVFDVVFLGQGVTTLPTGTKLVIEKKK